MNSILPVTAGWAKASGPVFKDETKGYTFRLRAKLLPRNADLYICYHKRFIHCPDATDKSIS